MSYFNAARKAGTCITAVREEEDYLYDTPHLFSNETCPAQRTSYCAISQAVRSTKSDGADLTALTPDGWEIRWLTQSEAA